MRRSFAVVCLGALLSACAESAPGETADVILVGGRVITLAQLKRQRQAIIEDEIVRRGFVPETPAEETNMMLEWVALPLAEEFGVSAMAMRIRMQELKLIVC